MFGYTAIRVAMLWLGLPMFPFDESQGWKWEAPDQLQSCRQKTTLAHCRELETRNRDTNGNLTMNIFNTTTVYSFPEQQMDKPTL